MKIRFVTIAAIAALGLSACGETAVTDAPAVPETAAAAEPVATQSSPILLASEGLKVQEAPGGEVRTIALGAPRDEAVAAVSQALGAPPQEVLTIPCADIVSWGRRFEMGFKDGVLTGWQSATDELNTTRGIHVGSSVEDLRTAYPELDIEEASIGWVFGFGEMDGTLDMYGKLDDSQTRVELIRLGENCDMH